MKHGHLVLGIILLALPAMASENPMSLEEAGVAGGQLIQPVKPADPADARVRVESRAEDPVVKLTRVGDDCHPVRRCWGFDCRYEFEFTYEVTRRKFLVEVTERPSISGGGTSLSERVVPGSVTVEKRVETMATESESPSKCWEKRAKFARRMQRESGVPPK